jgi:hypothetical protein
VLAVSGGTVCLLTVALIAFLLLPAIGDVSGKSLGYSVTREAEGSVAAGLDACDRNTGDVWRCEVTGDYGSSTVRYRVTMRGSRCWEGVKLSQFREAQPLESRPSGCVKLRDQVRVVDRLLSPAD